MEKILILDFGSQTTALIGRRIREMGVRAEIIPGDSPLTKTALNGVGGIILSGSPESVYENGAAVDAAVYSCGLPLLGICYGLQRITADLGGEVRPLAKREYGGVEVALNDVPPEKLNVKAASFLAAFAPESQARSAWGVAEKAIGTSPSPHIAWMSHGDTLTRLAPGFVECGTSATGFQAVVVHESKPWFGVQFHPEVTHSQCGLAVLRAFAFDVCGAQKNWSMEQYLGEACARLKKQAGGAPVLLLISGGVDSTVAAAMLLKSLDARQVHLMYMDTGLMRKNETELVRTALLRLGARHLHIIDCGSEFLNALTGVDVPETKRKIIGDLFISIQEREVARLGLRADYLLAQGTLYTDLIESGKGVGSKAHVIKSHHNVAGPLVEAKRKAGLILEPLAELYKDEVRALGRLLGLERDVVMRHPFPGPGLAVRILGEVTAEKCRILREADSIFIDELKNRKNSNGTQSLYDDIWQAFAVLLPIRSVGVAGDVRKYGWVLALRAVTSSDGMTADVYPFPPKDLLEISTLITNSVPEIGRISYDVSSKPPATIEWE